ncbi:hypothetical protein ACQKLP_10760 [Chitinophaga sp. NPDC101104]|uniref:hypothetical protein n=1 Tax=Chitinophaga sp. NPDC101104 TaxID=3390561 RepID=UPI003D0728A8
MKKMYYIVVILLFLSCTKASRDVYTPFQAPANSPMVDCLIRNFANFSHGDTLFPAGMKDKSFLFVYAEKNAAVIRDKLYQSTWYNQKMMMVARNAYHEIACNATVSLEELTEYYVSLKLFHANTIIDYNFTWSLWDLH